MKNEIKIIFTGGGSGGHTMPAFSMIETVKNYSEMNNFKLSILYIGSKNSVEQNTALRYKIDFKSINTGKLRRYFSFKNITDIFRIIIGFLQSLIIISKFKPDVIFSTGGFVSVPPVIAGKLKKIPVVIHEQTIDAGLANKIASKFADKVCLTFSESQKYFPENKTVITGIPLRNEIYNGSIENAKRRYKFDFNLPVIFFTGGGLGCHLLNEIGLEIIPELLEKYNIIFQTGKSNDSKDFEELKKIYDLLGTNKKNRFAIYDFINEEIGDIYAITTLAIARSGAGTVNELMTLRIPAIFIPLAISTNNEQLKNAMIMQKMGTAVIIEEKYLNSRILLEMINTILSAEKITEMKTNLLKKNIINARENILQIILDLIKS